MKDKIKQVYKNQKECALALNINQNRLGRMVLREDSLLSEYLDLKKENMRLREALRTFQQCLK